MTGVIATIPKFQFSNATGTPLANGTLTVYLAGTTTLTNTWQDYALTSLNTNPVVLDSRGECVLWLDSAVTYKFVLKNSSGVVQWTQDNLSGAGAAAAILETALASSVGAVKVGSIQSGSGSVARTLQDEIRESVKITQFGATTSDLTGTVNNAALVAALAVSNTVLIPPGTFYVTGGINIKGKTIIGTDAATSALKLVGTNTNASMFINGSDINTAWGFGGGATIRFLRLIGNWDGSTSNSVTDISSIGGLVKWWSASYLKIQNCNMESFYGFGIFSYKMGYSEITSSHIFVGAKNGIHLEAPSGAEGITTTAVKNNSVHSIRGSSPTGGSCIYIKNGFTASIYNNTLEDCVNGVTIDGQDNRNITLLGNHIEQTSGYCVNYLGSGNRLALIGNILATVPVLFQTNAQFSPYTAINNFSLEDTYSLPSISAAPNQVSFTAASPKTTINSLLLTPGEWDITSAFIGTNSGGTGQMSSRQEFALNISAAIPSYSSSFAYSTVRGDCISSVNTADGFMNSSLSLKITVTSNTTIYLYGGPASITNTLSVSCTGWIRAKKVGGPY
jgi:hypothetical protein